MADNSESEAVLAAVIKGVNFAAVKHKDQRRKDPEQTPYINHPVGVAYLLVESGIKDLAVLQAALLHDTVEDTETSHEELVLEFGPKVAGIVAEAPGFNKPFKLAVDASNEGAGAVLLQDDEEKIDPPVTDNKNLDKQERKRLQIIKARSASREAKLVKLADKLYNLRDLDRTIPQGWTQERVEEYFQWAAKVVAGCRGNSEFLEGELDKLFVKWKVNI